MDQRCVGSWGSRGPHRWMHRSLRPRARRQSSCPSILLAAQGEPPGLFLPSPTFFSSFPVSDPLHLRPALRARVLGARSGPGTRRIRVVGERRCACGGARPTSTGPLPGLWRTCARGLLLSPATRWIRVVRERWSACGGPRPTGTGPLPGLRRTCARGLLLPPAV